MSTLAQRLRSEAGMTIAELLMAAFVGLVVLGTVFGAVAVQGRSAVFQSGLADAQLTGRGAGEILQQDLRMAGFGMLGVPPGENLAALEMAQQGGVTTLTLRGAYGNVQSNLLASAAAGTSSLVVSPPAAGSFTEGEKLLVDSGLSAEVKTISSVSTVGGNLTLGLDSALAHGYPIGPSVTQIEEVEYTWDGTLLRRNAEVLADRTTTFQLQYIDQAGITTATPDEDLRAVVLDLVAQHPSALPDGQAASSRVSTEVNVRNLAFRFSLG